MKNNRPGFHYFMLLFFVFIFGAPGCSQYDSASVRDDIKEIKRWQYQWGDSPTDSSGRLTWLVEGLPNGQLTRSTFGFDNAGQNQFLWLSTTIPEGNWPAPHLYLSVVHLSFEAYVDSVLIYKQGNFKASRMDKYHGFLWHLIPLKREHLGQRLALRVFSTHPEFIGIHTTNDEVLVGSELDILYFLLKINADSVIFGYFFIFIGLFSFFIFLRRFHRREFFLASFGLLSVAVGIFYITQDRSAQLFMKNVVMRYYLAFISFYLFPVGLYAFIEQSLESGKNKILRALWILHLFICVLLVPLDVIMDVPMAVTQRFYLWVFIGTIFAAVLASWRAAVKGDRAARVLLTGFIIFGLLGLNDLFTGLFIFSESNFMSHWGMLIFILCLGYLLERRFTYGQEQIEAYSRDLEIISVNLKESKKQLEDYSQTLEQKVDARTSDLNRKNTELQNALKQLHETQDQLLLKEKMASLGDLVAGVAHEVNNPIGAINSAADVSRRCLRKIREILTPADSEAQTQENPELQKALSVLEDNTNVVNLASQRVTKIVRSLKNFARLDEAELQEADIHDGLDSTLTLLEHELKNRIKVRKQYGTVPMIKCFPNQLNQVFMNILKNASQSIAGKGEINIRTQVEDRQVIIEISDSGSGISPEKLERIFDPGFTTKGVGVGTGLGLSISYNIIQKHNGTISVTSEVGKGTTFLIKLPIM